MGCNDSRDVRKEEQCLIFTEKKLGFHLKQLSEVHLSLTKDAVDNQLNEDQMDKFVRYLKFPMQSSANDSLLETMFSFFKTEDGYCLQALIISGCLLSIGSASEKASTLFCTSAGSKEDILNREQVHKLFEVMISISIEYIPELVYGSRAIIKPKGIRNYVECIHKNRHAAINLIVYQLMGNSQVIHKTSFVTKLRKSELRTVLEPKGIRKFLLNFDNIQYINAL